MRRVSSCLTIMATSAVLLASSLCFAASAPHSAKANGWVQLAELTPANRNNQDWFGISVAISGNTVVVGAFDPNIEATGTAYVFVNSSGGWGNMTADGHSDSLRRRSRVRNVGCDQRRHNCCGRGECF